MIIYLCETFIIPKCYLAYLLGDPNYTDVSKWVKYDNLHKIRYVEEMYQMG